MDGNPIDAFEGEYHFLSNFYSCEILYGGITYPSTEHAFQAAKTADMDDRRKIADCAHPNGAKKLGQKVKLRPDWDTVKDQVMLQLLLIKFADPILMAKLRETLPHELIEGNHWGDFYWGVCGGRGLNKLGKLLMRIRLNYTSVYLDEFNRLKRKLIPSLLDALSRLEDTTTPD